MSEKHVTVWVQHRADRSYDDLQWYDPVTGRRRCKSAETCNPMEAERKRAALEYELNHGLYRESSNMPWERFRALFEAEHVAARRPNTRENYTAMLNGFERLCKPGSLRSVTQRTVSQYAAALRSEPGRARGTTGQAPATIRQRLQLLKTALAWAVQQKLMPELPRFPSVKVPRKRPQPIPAESFERLVQKAPDANLRTYLLCGWLGGLRLAEAAALEWEPADKSPYLDLAGDRIVFPAEFVKAVEDQWVPLDPVLRQAVEALPRRGRKVFRFVAKDGHPVCLNAIGERVMRLAKKAGVKLTMHSLRKGFGCRYAGKVPAQVLQRLMRHSNISLTMAYYANVDDAMRQAVLGEPRTTTPPRTTLRTSQDSATPAELDLTPQTEDGESL
jgi:integrase